MLISAYLKRTKLLFSSSSFNSLSTFSCKSRQFSIMPHQQNRFFDITSDTATEPTDDMFELMKAASKGDDVFGVCIQYIITSEYLIMTLLIPLGRCFCKCTGSTCRQTPRSGISIVLCQWLHDQSIGPSYLTDTASSFCFA